MRVRNCLLIAGCWALSKPGLVSATTFVLSDEQQLAQQADAVLVGFVQRVEVIADRRRDSIMTEVEVSVEQVVSGTLSDDNLVLLEPGGDLGDRAEHVLGSPLYQVGEEVLVFVSLQPDGNWATTSMAMGKYRVIRGASAAVVTRDLGPGVAVLDKHSAALQVDPLPQAYGLEAVIASVRAARRGYYRSLAEPLELGSSMKQPGNTRPFEYLGIAARWFEPDDGIPVSYLTDALGDATLGHTASQIAANAAMAAWSNVPTSTLEMRNGGAMDPAPVSGCSGPNQIVFNDPGQQVSNPYYCSGVLAMGRYCTGAETRSVHGTSFRRITSGKIVFNDGWTGCAVWNLCNVSEVLTHELGHTIGIGHSKEFAATMHAYAHFDGRCGGLVADDVAAVSTIYPAGETMHDVVVLPVRPVRLTIRAGYDAASKVLPVRVRNADSSGAGNRIQLVAEDGTCPVGTTARPDFGLDPQSPDSVFLAAGGSARAFVRLNAPSAAFSTPDRRTPQRCSIVLRALSTLPGNVDPVPANDRFEVEIDVVDGNDAGGMAVVQTQIGSAKPVALRIAKRTQQRTTTRRLVVRNTSLSGGGQAVRVRVEDGDCPSGTVAGMSFSGRRSTANEVVLGPGQRRAAKLSVRADRQTFASMFRDSPARCRVRLSVETADSDGNRSNDVTWMQIDVVDENDM